jgi:hypothetical protein
MCINAPRNDITKPAAASHATKEVAAAAVGSSTASPDLTSTPPKASPLPATQRDAKGAKEVSYVEFTSKIAMQKSLFICD